MRALHVSEKKGRERRRAAAVSNGLCALLGLGRPKWKEEKRWAAAGRAERGSSAGLGPLARVRAYTGSFLFFL
jgi:hypothetical protein